MSIAIVPRPPVQLPLWPETEPQFCLQRLKVSATQIDYRLSLGDGYPVFQIPKGLSSNPNVYRLAVEGPAVRTAGSVQISDRGEFVVSDVQGRCSSEAVAKAFRSGELRLSLDGDRLRGDWILKRLRDRKWLIAKVDDAYAFLDDRWFDEMGLISA